MGQVGTIIGTLTTIIGVIFALKMVGYFLQMITVFNEGLSAVANDGSIAPYIVALMMIMIVAAIPGWLLAIADVDLF